MSALFGRVEVRLEAASAPGRPPCVYLGQAATPPPPPRPLPPAQRRTDRGLMAPGLEPEWNAPQRLDGERAPPRRLNGSSVGEGRPDPPRLLADVSLHYEDAGM